jgi:hypothetical protein
MHEPSDHDPAVEREEPGDGQAEPEEVRTYTSFGARSNRRARPGALRNCRLCWKPITVEARFVEEEPPRLFFRCPHCAHAFPIRRADIQAAAEVTAPPPAPEAAEQALDAPPPEIWSTIEKSVIDRLDLDAVRALLNQIEAIHERHESTKESLALRDALCGREQLLIALEDVGQAMASIEAEFPPTR